jgi:tight adherence protein C
VSGASLLAVCAALLVICAVRELLASQTRLALEAERRLTGWRRRGARAARGAGMLRVEARLRQAGLAGRIPPVAVAASRVLGAASGLVAGVIASPAAPGRLSWLVLAGFPAAGALAPDALLERAARRRRERLVAALPDALDRLAVGAAAGRSIAAAFAEIAAAGDGPLEVEMAVASAEISAGTPQEESLAALRDRVSGSELATLAAAIDRSRRFGSPLADHLRRQASALRVSQRRNVQDRAARAAPKIQLVVALVLVPSVLLMIAAGLIANSEVLLGGY